MTPWGCRRPQRPQQHLGIVVDRSNRMHGEQIGEQPHHRLAVLQHIGDTGRHARIVLEDIKIVGGNPHHVDAGDVHIGAPRQIEPQHLRAETRIVEDQIRRDASCLKNVLLVIDVVEKRIDRPHALADAGADGVPLFRIKNAGDDIERDQPLDPFLAAVHRKGDTEPAEDEISLLMFFGQLRGRGTGQPFLIGTVGITNPVFQSVHFVKGFTGLHGRPHPWVLHLLLMVTQSRPKR